MEEPGKFYSNTSLFRCILLSLTSVLLFCAGSLASPLSAIGITALLFSPTPLALLGARENRIWMAIGLFSAAASLVLLFDTRYTISFLLDQGFLCLGLTLPLGRIKNGSESLLFCIIVSIVSKLFFVILSVALTGSNPFVMEPNAMRSIMSQMYSGMPMQGGENFEESIEYVVSIVPYMAPSMILMLAMFDSFLNYRLCETLQRKQAVQFPPLPVFGEWRFPKSLMWALLFAFIMPMLSGGEQPWRLGITLEVNIKFIVLILFFLQGMSLAWWWLSRRAIHFLLRAMIMILLMLPFLGMWVVALGVADICIDFRTKKIKQA